MFDRIRPPETDEGATGSGPADGGEQAAADEPTVSGDGSASLTCGQCGARVIELRRGRCWGCYQVWSGARPVGQGARCVVCAERRRDSLRLTEIHGRWFPMCHGCAVRTSRLSPVPYTVEGLRRALGRERRREDRRIDALDVRVFPRERRDTDRRNENRTADDDPGDLWIELDPSDIEVIEVTSPVDLAPAIGDKTDPHIQLPPTWAADDDEVLVVIEDPDADEDAPMAADGDSAAIEETALEERAMDAAAIEAVVLEAVGIESVTTEKTTIAEGGMSSAVIAVAPPETTARV